MPNAVRAEEPTLSRAAAGEIIQHLTTANRGLTRLQVILRDPENWIDRRFQRPSLRRIVVVQARIDRFIEQVERAASREAIPELLVVFDKETIELFLAFIVLTAQLADPAPSLGDAIQEEIENASSILNQELFPVLGVELFCFDRLDNDGDGLTDGDDPDCR